MNTQIVNETSIFVKASDGSILAGESLADILAHQASHSWKVKGFATYSKTSIKFYNGSVKMVDVPEAEYRAFEGHLKASGWQLRPQVTSGGFTATRGN